MLHISNSQNLETTQSLNKVLDSENVYIYTMEYFSAIKNNDFMIFLDKWVKLENPILREVSQSQKNWCIHSMYSLLSDY